MSPLPETFPYGSLHLGDHAAGFSWLPPLGGDRNLLTGISFHEPSPLGAIAARWRRNVDLLPIDYAFRPRLRDRLTLGGMTFPRKP